MFSEKQRNEGEKTCASRMEEVEKNVLDSPSEKRPNIVEKLFVIKVMSRMLLRITGNRYLLLTPISPVEHTVGQCVITILSS